MSTITETPLVLPAVSHVPWWRGKIVQVGAIVGVMWLAYRGWKSEYPWPNDLVWNGLQAKFDSVQTYLIDQRLEGVAGSSSRSSTASASSRTTSSAGSTTC